MVWADLTYRGFCTTLSLVSRGPFPFMFSFFGSPGVSVICGMGGMAIGVSSGGEGGGKTGGSSDLRVR
jgi:hypothetical protein